MLIELNETFNSNVLQLGDYISPHPWCSYLDQILLEIRRSILCGSYISALAVLGFYLEMLVKEIYFAYNGKRFEGAMGNAIEAIKDIIAEDYYNELISMKNKLRNPVTHGNFSELLSDVYFTETIPTSPIRTIDEFRNSIKSDIHKFYIEASKIPTIAFCISYETYFKKLAFESYNSVYELAFLLSFNYLTTQYKTSEILDSERSKLTETEFEKKCTVDGVMYEFLKQQKHIVMTRETLNELLK